jgi:hypothetical protein
VVQHRRLRGPRRAQVVVHRDGVQQLGRCACALEHSQAEVHVPKQRSLLRRCEGRRRAKLERPPGVVHERRREEKIGAEARVQLCRLARKRRDANGVLEEPARVRVVGVGCRRIRAKRRSREYARHRLSQPDVGDLGNEELEEAFELLRVPAHCWREGRRVDVRRFECPHLELETVAELLHASEHAHRVALAEASVQQLDVVPHPPGDAPRCIGELEREVGRAGPRLQPLLLGHGKNAVDDAVFGQLRDRRHATESKEGSRYRRGVADVRPFRAERYDETVAGPLSELVAPPYDVISEDQRRDYLARSPYNVVHVTLPGSADEAARALAEWRGTGVLKREEESAWTLSQAYVGPDGVERTRNGIVVALRLEPYESGVVLPHERTHAGPKEELLQLLRATRTQREPIFLLHDGRPVSLPDREPDVEIAGPQSHDRLWRTREVPDVSQLLIADGHHRYETALAFHDEDGTDASAWMMIVLVSTREQGLTIFPTHRLAQLVNGARGEPIDEPGDELPGVVLYRDGRYELVRGDGLDVDVVDALRPGGVTYTPERAEAVAAVDRGDAEAAFLLRPTPLEAVFERARRGEVMPQKTTYFFPKLTSGLLFQPLE